MKINVKGGQHLAPASFTLIIKCGGRIPYACGNIYTSVYILNMHCTCVVRLYKTTYLIKELFISKLEEAHKLVFFFWWHNWCCFCGHGSTFLVFLLECHIFMQEILCNIYPWMQDYVNRHWQSLNLNCREIGRHGWSSELIVVKITPPKKIGLWPWPLWYYHNWKILFQRSRIRILSKPEFFTRIIIFTTWLLFTLPNNENLHGCLLYVFGLFFGLDYAENTIVLWRTNEQKHFGYVIRACLWT